MAEIENQDLEKKEKLFTAVHDVPGEELYTSGHRTCEGCESALVMRQFVKAAGPRTIATGSTGCMYVANTSYMTTPWVIPWMHSQLGAGGSSAIGTAMALRALMRKGKVKEEKGAGWGPKGKIQEPSNGPASPNRNLCQE